MKRVLWCVQAIVAVCVLCAFSPIVYASTGERIRAFVEDIQVTPDRRVVVTESISYDFGDSSRHGIYRDIPTAYERYGGSYTLRLRVRRVLQDDVPVEWTESDSGGVHQIKIGDPDEYIDGTHNYTIEYESDRLIQEFETGPELYWNVTGNEWNVPIDLATVTVTGPAVPTGTLCYTGSTGSTASRCTIQTNGVATTIKNEVPFMSREGLTIAIRWPASTFAPLPAWSWAWWFLQDNWTVGLPVVVFVIMLSLWWRFGKEPRGRGTVIAQYEPPAKMTPMEMRALASQVIDSRSFLATLLDLARRGYMRLEWSKTGLGNVSNSFHLFRVREADGELRPEEKRLLDSIFLGAVQDTGVSFTSAGPRLARQRMDIHKDVFGRLREAGFFTRSPDIVRGYWMTLAAVCFFAGHLIQGGVLGFSLMACAVIIGVFGYNMPRVTKSGAERKEEIDGFKLFLSVTEKDRLAFFNAPELRPETFEKFLPAAIALGVEEKWVHRFDIIGLQQPSYVVMPTGMSWNASTAIAMSSAYASSFGTSSGFSGGRSGVGGGGGGGGSW